MSDNDLTIRPGRLEPTIEQKAQHLKKTWGQAAAGIIEALCDTHLFVTEHGRAAAIAALGPAWAPKILLAYKDLKPLAIKFSKLTNLPDLPK